MNTSPSTTRRAALAAAALGLSPVCWAQGAPAERARDYLGAPGPLRFDGGLFALVWSSRPSPGYVKQEYLPAGQRLDSYARMLLLERVAGVEVAAALRAQTQFLAKRKGSDPVVNWAVIENKERGEALLDFLVSANDKNGNLIVEWNGYRYVPHRDAAGASGTLLFGISHRAYGDAGAKEFLTGLKALRGRVVGVLAKAELPV
jgi:hypothetical protein